MAGLGFCTANPIVNYILVVRPACAYARMHSITCTYTCAQSLLKQIHVHTMYTWTRINSISSVERCNSSSGMRSVRSDVSLHSKVDSDKLVMT